MRSRLAIVLLAALTLPACSKLTEPPKQDSIQGEPSAAPDKKPTDAKPGSPLGSADKPRPLHEAFAIDAGPPPPPGKLESKDLAPGKGPAAKTGDLVRVHYVGTLTDGTEFDASKKHGNEGFSFPLGGKRVIQGWDQGVVGMKVGGKRKLTIPPDLGYGPRGSPPVIPPNATLIFEIEMLEIKPGKP